MKAWLVGLGLLSLAGAAQAMPLKLRNGSSLRVAVHGKRESGVGLRMKDKGWRLELAATMAGDEAEAVDVTDGAHESRWTIEVRDGALVFPRELRKDRISGWRWLLGAWGVGTYRQNDSVDVRYQAPDGSPRVAEGLEIEAG